MKAPVRLDSSQGYQGTRWTPPDREWLEYHYVTLDKSASAIAQKIGADGATVRKWLREGSFTIRTQAYALSGRRSPLWRGGTNKTVRKLLRKEGVPEKCARCGATEGRIDVHHIDGDHQNNDPKNLQYLCWKCHWYLHWRCGGEFED